MCAVPGCTTEFTIIERRHHCRRLVSHGDPDARTHGCRARGLTTPRAPPLPGALTHPHSYPAPLPTRTPTPAHPHPRPYLVFAVGRCGEAVCSKHFTQAIHLNEHAIPDPHGWPLPVCADCVETYKRRYGDNRFGAGSAAPVPVGPPFALPNPGRLAIPEVLVTGPNQELYLASVISHVGDLLAYFTRVRDTLAQVRDSVLRREYVLSERERMAKQVAALREHELGLNPLQYPHPYLDESLRAYVIDCMYKLQEAKAWAHSPEIVSLMSGATSLARSFVRRA